jgi:hypothetical protein
MKIKIIENFIDPQDAFYLMNEIENPNKGIYPDYYKDRNGGTALPYNKMVIEVLKKYARRANELAKDFFETEEDIHVTKAFGSKWTPGQSGNPHIDAIEKEPFIEYSTVIYLNDKYEGGNIYFPNQDFSHRPNKYSAIMFPGNSEDYRHGISEIKSGLRYTALFMQSTKMEFADPDFL